MSTERLPFIKNRGREDCRGDVLTERIEGGLLRTTCRSCGLNYTTPDTTSGAKP